MGMALARRLALAGHSVDVFERDKQLGGLATHQDFGGFYWDRYYHVVLPSDRHLIGFIKDIGLSDELRWQRTLTGFYVDEKMHSISSSLEFLRFPLLSLVDKARLAWTMLYSSRIDNWQRLEKVPVEDWLIRVSGRTTYEKMWRPLLLAKLGENYTRASAVFIWSYIKRLFSARDSSASKEQLGHVTGGYKMIFERLSEIIVKAGGEVATDVEVTGIVPAGSGINIQIGDDTKRYDKVVCTSPVPVLKKLTDPSLLRVGEADGQVDYLGVVCMVLVTRKPVVPYYVVNIADQDIPFTGVIGMSNVVPEEHTGGRYLTYLPKYVLSTDDWLRKSDAEVEEQFLRGLKAMLPDFDETSVESIVINRARQVQPLQVIDFSNKVPTVDTLHKDFFVLNTAQFLNATLNNNEVIGAVENFVNDHADVFKVSAEISRPLVEAQAAATQ